jgi:hypothetical protein
MPETYNINELIEMRKHLEARALQIATDLVDQRLMRNKR